RPTRPPPMPYTALFRSAAAGDEERLHVEGEAVQDRGAEGRLGRLGGEELEAALGVVETRKHEEPHQPVEEPPHGLAVPGLADLRSEEHTSELQSRFDLV